MIKLYLLSIVIMCSPIKFAIKTYLVDCVFCFSTQYKNIPALIL